MPHPWFNIAGVQNALAHHGAAAQVVNAGPNVPHGVLLTEQIAWATPTAAPTAAVSGTPTTLVTVTTTATATPTIVVKRSINAADLENIGLLEDGQQGFDPEDPNVEIFDSLDEVGSGAGAGAAAGAAPAAPFATKVAGAFGPGGAPAHDTDFNFNKGPVPPTTRHRQKNNKEMKKAHKTKAKDTHKNRQQERKAYLAQVAAAEEQARAKAAGAR